MGVVKPLLQLEEYLLGEWPMVTSKTENRILANFTPSDETFQPEDRGLVIIGIKAGR